MKIKINNLSKEFNKIKVVNSINFVVKENTTIGLLGPNGCGKTTSIGMMLGLIKPTSGEVIINNKNIENNRTDLLQKINFITYSEGKEFEVSKSGVIIVEKKFSTFGNRNYIISDNPHYTFAQISNKFYPESNYPQIYRKLT